MSGGNGLAEGTGMDYKLRNYRTVAKDRIHVLSEIQHALERTGHIIDVEPFEVQW